MTMHVPGSDQRTDLRVIRDDSATPSPAAGSEPAPQQALGLLENARRVADATVGEARAEAERLLAAARERAQQVQRDARELGQRLRDDAERESARVRHQAFGEAERIVADAKAQVSTLESSVGDLQTGRDEAFGAVQSMVDRLSGLLHEHGPARGEHQGGPDDPGHQQ